MARISDVVKELAYLSGTPEPTVRLIARALREDGLLSQHGRGRSAAQATALDAARLLIALMVGGMAKDSPQAVRDFGRMYGTGPQPPSLIRPSLKPPAEQLTLEEICGLPREHKFEQAVAELIGIFGNSQRLYEVESAWAAVAHKLEANPFFVPLSVSIYDAQVEGNVLIAYNFYMYNSIEFVHWIEDSKKKLRKGNTGEIHPDETLEPLVGLEPMAESDKGVRARYASGIKSQRTVDQGFLQSLGEVVGDKKAAGSRILAPDEDVARVGHRLLDRLRGKGDG